MVLYLCLSRLFLLLLLLRLLHVLDSQFVEMLFSAKSLEHLYATLEQAAKGDPDRTKPAGARQSQRTRQHHKSGAVDDKLAPVECQLSSQNQEFAHEDVLFGIQLNLLLRIDFKTCHDCPLLQKLETDGVDSDDQLHHRFPKRASVLQLLPLVIEDPWRDEVKICEPDRVICEVVNATTHGRGQLQNA